MDRSFVSVITSVLLALCLSSCNQMRDVDYTEVAKLKMTNSEQSAVDETADPMADEVEPEGSAAKTTASDDAQSTEATKSDDASTKPVAATEPKAEAAPEIKVLVTEKDFSVVGPEDALRVTFDDIDLEKVLDLKSVPKEAPQFFPQWLKALDGKRVRMRGYMFPPFQEEGLRAFVLTRDTSACCFGPNPKVCYLIDTVMRKGQTTDYIENRPFDVIGVLHVGDRVEPGKLYTLDDAVVIAK